MAQVIKFYQTEGRSVIYARDNSKHHLAPILDNWEGTNEVRQKGRLLFITDRAFKYVPEVMQSYDLDFEVVEVSKEQEQQVKNVLDALADYKGEELESEEDDGEVTVSSYLELDLGNDVFVNVSVNASGIVHRDNGDYYTPPSHEVEWGDMILNDLEVCLDGENLIEFNDLQEQIILDAIEGIITLN